MDPFGELLEEPLFLDGIVVRRWSDLARLRRPRDASPDSSGIGTGTEADPEAPMP